MENQEKPSTEPASAPSNTVENIETPQVSINVTKSEAGDLTVITLVAEKNMNDRQLAMVLQALGNNILEQQPPVSGAV